MSLYTTLVKKGRTEKEASHIATQLANRFGEELIELDPVDVMPELDYTSVISLRGAGKRVYWLEVHEDKYFDGNIRVPYCVLMYDMDNLRGGE